ncbi:hypothetical protein VPH35_124159 [Triticum aestivum]
MSVAFCFLSLLSTLYSLLLLIILFLEQSVYENLTGPSDESNGDDYNYTGDLDVDPSSAMMVRIRIPPSRVRGQHALLLWQMMQELGAPCPQFFEEMPDDGTHSYRRVVVVLSGVPSDMDFYVELSTMQRSSDGTLPMQEVAKEAMLGLRARFGEKLRTTGYRDLPALDSGGLGQNHQQGPRGASLGVGSSSAQPTPIASTVSTTSSMTMIADTMMYHTMKEELIRHQEATQFWYQCYQMSEHDRVVLQGALNAMPGGPLNPIIVPGDVQEEEEEDPEEVELEEQEEVEGVENPNEPLVPPSPNVPPTPPQPLPEHIVEPEPALQPDIEQQQLPHFPIPRPHQPDFIHPHMSVSSREYREAATYARVLGLGASDSGGSN